LFSNLLTERICEGETKDDIKEEERVGKEGEYKKQGGNDCFVSMKIVQATITDRELNHFKNKSTLVLDVSTPPSDSC